MRRTLPILAVAVVLGLALAPAAAAAADDVSVTQAEDGSATVTVTENGSAVADAAVSVSTTDENATYAGTGEYTTGENGTVGLPAPEETVDVTITATSHNETVSVAGTLEAAEGENETEDGSGEEVESFGELVSTFVHGLQNESDNETKIGPQVASYVLEHSPAAAMIPDHAGPPAHVTGENATDGEKFKPVDVGPPEETGHQGDQGGGPPEDSGQPDHAGPGEDEQ